MSTPTDPEFELALSRFLDGDATPQDEIHLVQAIETNPAARAEVRRHLLLDDLLRQHQQQNRDPGAFVDALRLRLSCAGDEAFVQRVSTALTLQHSSAAPSASSEKLAPAERPAHGRTRQQKWRTPGARMAQAAAAMLMLSAAGAWMAWMWNGQPTATPAVAQSAPAASERATPSPLPSQTTQAAPEYGESSIPAMPDPEPMPTEDAGAVVIAAAEESRLFTLPSQVRVLGSPGTSLAMVNAMLVNLNEGRVAADAGSSGKGFTVRTPQASIVDVGTLFGVQARADGAGITDVVVFSGAVLLTPQGAGTGTATSTRTATKLTTGQAVSVDAQGRLLRLASLTAPERWQFWQTEPMATQCIASIDEPEPTTAPPANANAAAQPLQFQFHRIIPGGLKEGAAVAMAHPERWGAVTGKKFPRSLLGADYVQSPAVMNGTSPTANTRWPLRVTVQKPATLYLLVSQAAPPPKWLTARFTRTGEEIASVIITDGKPKARISNSFDIWKQTLDTPTTLTLGEPARMSDGKLTPMYGIAAKPR